MARRFYVAPLPPPGHCRLPQDVAHHVARVMRARAGEALVLFDGAGRECHGEILRVQGSVVEALLTEPVTSQREPSVAIEVAVALPGGTRADWLFEHGTEVGIAAFRPVSCTRDHPAQGAARETDKRTPRWQRIVQAAAGQCNRARLPAIHEILPLAQLLAAQDLPAERYLAQPDAPPLGRAASDRALLLVGPPGGFTEDEVTAATAAGFEPRSLGILTLRTETAAIAGAVRLLAEPG